MSGGLMRDVEIPSIDTTIEDALRRESELLEIYHTTAQEIGYDASGLFDTLAAESECHITKLKEFQEHVRTLRVLWCGMVD
jgi:hypothetical protein